MYLSALFGILPKGLVLDADEAQHALYLWYCKLERELEELWGKPLPRNVTRRRARRLQGMKLAMDIKIRREMRIINALYKARYGYVLSGWANLPATPTIETAKAQLEVLFRQKSHVNAFMDQLDEETILQRYRELQKAKDHCEAEYKKYWNSLK